MTTPEPFAMRLRRVIAGRKIDRWTRGLGIAAGTRARMLKGEGIPPTYETLARIMRTENVSLNWLLGGNGPPYLVSRTIDDAETAELLRVHLDDEAWETTLISGGSLQALLLEQPASVEHGSGTTSYRATVVIAGPVGTRTLHTWETTAQPDKLFALATIGADDMQRLYAGELGTWQLLGDETRVGIARGPGRAVSRPLTNLMGKPVEGLAVADNPVQSYIPIPAVAKLQHHWTRIGERERQALSTFIDLATEEKDSGKR